MRDVFYVLRVSGGAEPLLSNAFDNDGERDEHAREIFSDREQYRDEYDSIFWLDISRGETSIGTYPRSALVTTRHPPT